MQKAGHIFFITFVMALVLTVTLILGAIISLSGMAFFLPLITVLYVVIGIFVVRAVVDWKKHQKFFNRVMAVSVVLSLLYAIPGIYEKTTITQEGHVDTYFYELVVEQSKAV